MNKLGRVIDVNISIKKGVIKEPVSEAMLIEDYGIEGDAHAGKWHRQVSFLAKESIDKMKALGIEDLTSGKFAENITTENIVLYELAIGTRIRISESILEVTQIGKECHGGCEIRKKIGDCVMPREGIFAKVIKGGLIKAGDIIEIL